MEWDFNASVAAIIKHLNETKAGSDQYLDVGKFAENIVLGEFFFNPSPLYLNRNTVFVSPIDAYEGPAFPGLDIAKFDNFKIWIGHWKRRTDETFFGDPKNTALWFDNSNKIISPMGTSNRFVPPNSVRFITPRWLEHTVPVLDARFGFIEKTKKSWRFLADRYVRTDDALAHKTWDLLLEGYWATPGADGMPSGIDEEKELKLALIDLITDPATPPLPHYHFGYVDTYGQGFTTSMEIVKKYKGLHQFILENLSEEHINLAVPIYHTHTLTSPAPDFGNEKNIVDHGDHKNTYPYEYSGLFTLGQMEKTGVPDEVYDTPMNIQHEGYEHLSWHNIADVSAETTFLEMMSLYYNDAELGRVVALEGDMPAPPGVLVYADVKPENPLWLGEIFPRPSEDTQDHDLFKEIMSKYYYKRQKFKKHLIGNYLQHMHDPATGYKNASNYQTFEDKVFVPKTQIIARPGYRSSTYNYTKEYYENALSLLTNTTGHRLIPNPYLFGQFNEDSNRFKMKTPGAKEFAAEYAGLIALNSLDLWHAKKSDLSNYLYLWSKTVSENMGDVFIDGISTKAVYGFPKYDFIKKYEPTPYVYPWHIKLGIATPSPFPQGTDEFPDKRGTFINDIFAGLYDAQTGQKSDELMLFFMAKVADKNPDAPESENSQFGTSNEGSQYYKQDFYVREKNLLKEMEIETFDFTDWTRFYYQDAQALDFKTDNLLSFDLGTEEIWQDAMNIEAALIQLKDKVEEFHNTRSVYEILDADGVAATPVNTLGYDAHPFAHNEIMFYEIKKYARDPFVSGKLIQRYFIAPPIGTKKDKGGMIEFFDSQVKMDQGYRYEVDVYVLVIGNKYHYTDFQTRGFKLMKPERGEFDNNPKVGEIPLGDLGVETETLDTTEYYAPGQYYITVEGTELVPDVGALIGNNIDDIKFKTKTVYEPVADVFVVNKPTVELLKIPYTSFQTIYVANKPPLHPNVVIYPWKNINNKLLFTLSQFVGKKIEEPIEILPDDKEIFVRAARSQGSIDAGDMELPETMEFVSDEPDVKYQVFRIEEHPSSWSDFSTGLRKPVLSQDGSYRELEKYEKDFVENLSPNKKYYYTFRTIDSRGYISNPSPIYQVELVDDSGAVYLITKIITFKPKIAKTATKSMRKYVHIVPTMKQSNMITPDTQSAFIAEGVTENVSLGGLFGSPLKPKKFKIRFTSKSSGKKFDLNLSFAHSKKQMNLAAYINTKWNPIFGSFFQDETEQVPSDIYSDENILDGVGIPADLDKPY